MAGLMVTSCCLGASASKHASWKLIQKHCDSKTVQQIDSSLTLKDLPRWLMLLNACSLKATTQAFLAQPRLWQMLWNDQSLHLHLLALLEKERCMSNFLEEALSSSALSGGADTALKVTVRHLQILHASCHAQINSQFVRKVLLPRSSRRAKKILRSWASLSSLPGKKEEGGALAPAIATPPASITTSAVYLAHSGRTVLVSTGRGQASRYCFLANGDTAAMVDSKHANILANLVQAPTDSVGHLLRWVHRQSSASFTYGWYRYREHSLTVHVKYRIGTWIALRSMGQITTLCDSIWDRQQCTGKHLELPVADDDTQVIIVMGNRKMLRQRPSLTHFKGLHTSEVALLNSVIMEWINSSRSTRLRSRARPVALVTLIQP